MPSMHASGHRDVERPCGKLAERSTEKPTEKSTEKGVGGAEVTLAKFMMLLCGAGVLTD